MQGKDGINEVVFEGNILLFAEMHFTTFFVDLQCYYSMTSAIMGIFLQVATRLENPTRLYMLESQKRQVRQFLSSEEIDNNGTTDCRGNNNDNNVSINPQINNRQRISDNLLAPPTLNHSALTNSAPAENYVSYSKQNFPHYEGTIQQGKRTVLIFEVIKYIECK